MFKIPDMCLAESYMLYMDIITTEMYFSIQGVLSILPDYYRYFKKWPGLVSSFSTLKLVLSTLKDVVPLNFKKV